MPADLDFVALERICKAGIVGLAIKAMGLLLMMTNYARGLAYR
jgi:hypothetical protein